MFELLNAAILTGVLFMVQLMCKEKRSVTLYFTYFVIVWLILHTFSVHADEGDGYIEGSSTGENILDYVDSNGYIPYADEAICVFDVETARYVPTKMTYDFVVYSYESNSIRSLEKFRALADQCWWYPNVTDKQKVKICFLTAMGAVAPSEPRGRLICMVLSMVSQLALEGYDHYAGYISKLKDVEHHQTMAEFYRYILMKFWGKQLPADSKDFYFDKDMRPTCN